MDHSNSPSQTHTANYSDSCSRRASARVAREKERTTRIKDPTQAELCQTIMLMKEQLPGRSLQKAIQMMYDYVIKKRPPEKIFCDYVPPLIHIPQAPTNYKYLPRGRAEIAISYEKKHLLQEQFQSQEQGLDYTEKRLVAKSFVAHGRCEQAARQQFARAKRSFLKQRKDGAFPAALRGQDYQKVLNEALFQSFRRLELFLTENSILAIRALPEEDANRVTEILSQEKAANYGFVIKKYLRFQYGLSNVTLQEVQTVELYLQLLKILYGKKVTADAIQTFFHENKQPKVGSSIKISSLTVSQDKKSLSMHEQQGEAFIIQTYKQTKSYGEVFKQAMQKFSCSRRQVKYIMLEMYKKALEAVSTEAAKHNFVFPPINEALYNKIFSLKQCQDLRFNLLEFYQNPSQASPDDLFFLVEMAKELIQTDETTFEQCSSLEEEQIIDQATFAFQGSKKQDIQMEQ